MPPKTQYTKPSKPFWCIFCYQISRLTSDKEICQLQEAKHLLQEILQHASVYELQLDIIHQQQTIIHQQEAILLPLQEAIPHDGRALQLQEALLYELETIPQHQTEKIATFSITN